MTQGDNQASFDAFLDQWLQAARNNDNAATGALLADDYRMEFPDGSTVTWQEEQAFRQTVIALEVVQRDVEFPEDGTVAQADLLVDLTQEDFGANSKARLNVTISAARIGDGWKARHIRSVRVGLPDKLVEAPARRSFANRLKSAAARILPGKLAEPNSQSNHLPYMPGESFLLGPRPERLSGSEFPIPPEHLWLGYNYPMHGKLHVDTMLEALRGTGFDIRDGDRVIDLGCGAGRMIRHLQPYAETCEIWGLDISAEHIFWCRENLSPPFRFATTTKVPTLPFKDESVALVYCGSLFTHIDDLADAWLCELRRILKPDGRLFLTMHDEHTIDLLGQPAHSWTPLARLLHDHDLSRQISSGLGMLSIGRDDLSQVFYGRAYFQAMAEQSFEILDTIEEAYFYQTAMVLKPR